MEEQSATSRGGGGRRALRNAAEISRAICTLPAVATLDWCDRAAACLARVARPSVSVVLIGSIDAQGTLAVEASGVATGRAPAPGDEAGQIAPLSEADQSQLTTLRSRLERLSALGPHGAGLLRADPSAKCVDDLAPGQDWHAGALGRLWHGFRVADLILGRASLPGAEAGRSIMVILGLTAPGAAAADDQAALLEGVLPVAAHRARVALGPSRTAPSQWLTAREQEVLDQLTLGKSVKQIAEDLGRSPHTVHDHVKSLHKKLRANTRGELVARALGHIEARSDLDEPVERVLRSPERPGPESGPRKGTPRLSGTGN